MVRFNINKFFGCFVILLTLSLSSCKNDVVDVKRDDAIINILLNNVLTPFTAYTQSNMDMYVGEGIPSKIVVKAFIYDDSGTLINSFSKEIADYNQDPISFTTSLTGSNPQIVCITYATYTNSKGNKYDAYKISGENLLTSLKIERDYGYLLDHIPWQVLGGAIKTIGMGSEKTDIEIKPLGGLVYLDWNNIHAHAGEAKAPQRYMFMQKYNDVTTIKEGQFSFSSSLSSTYYFYADVFPSKYPAYNSIYEVKFMLPSNVESFGKGEYSPSNYKVDDDEETIGKTSTISTQVEAGKQYVFQMDCKEYTINAWEGVLDD